MKDATWAAKAEWQLWYQDTFDWESPRHVVGVGQGLAAGLKLLWAHHLRETVRPDGSKGFARFNLWLPRTVQSVKIVGDWQGQVRLREWVYRGKRGAAAPDEELLQEIVAAHQALFVRGNASRPILTVATAARSREAFRGRLLTVAQVG